MKPLLCMLGIHDYEEHYWDFSVCDVGRGPHKHCKRCGEVDYVLML